MEGRPRESAFQLLPSSREGTREALVNRVALPIAPVARDSEGPARSMAQAVGAWARGLVVGLDQRQLLVVIALLCLGGLNLVRPTDIDFWWHVKTGELIARTLTVPTVDPYSFTASGRPWVVHEWLWELGIYEVTRVGGFWLATLISALVVTVANVIIYRLLRALGVNTMVAVVLVVVAALLALPSDGVRPREFTQLFLAYYVSRLLLYRMGQVRYLWGLPIAMLFWVNLHGPFILGLVVLGVFVLGALVQFLGEWLQTRGAARLPGHLLLVAVATIAATAVNPRGPRMLLYPIGYYLNHDNPSFATVTEFQSPNFHDPLYLLFGATLLLFMVIGSRKRDLDLVTALLLAGFTAQALISARNVMPYAMVVIPLLGTRLGERFSWAGELKPPRSSARRVVVNWLLLAVFVAGGILYCRQPAMASRLQLAWTPNTDALPVGAARFIEQQNLPGPIFNNQGWGGYLIYRWYPDRKVFIDGRVDMYGTKLVQEYLDVVDIHPDWREVLDRYGIQTVLIERDSALSTVLLDSPGWTRVYHGKVADVFVRQASAQRGAASEGSGSG